MMGLPKYRSSVYSHAATYSYTDIHGSVCTFVETLNVNNNHGVMVRRSQENKLRTEYRFIRLYETTLRYILIPFNR